MDVLIKGMEMPKNCEDCPCIDYKNWRCQVDDLWDKEHCPDSGRPDWCPLIPVPPHGRLIDADALIADLKRQCREVFRVNDVSQDDFWIERNEAYNERLWKTWCESFYGYLQTRPTIIPASEDGET